MARVLDLYLEGKRRARIFSAFGIWVLGGGFEGARMEGEGVGKWEGAKKSAFKEEWESVDEVLSLTGMFG